MIITWLTSAASILPDAMGYSGNYGWSNTLYGCDGIFCGHKNYGMMINTYGNVLLIWIRFDFNGFIRYKIKYHGEFLLK